jgi:hypothetical protein
VTEQQALKRARKFWGKRAAVQVQKHGAFIGEDLVWREWPHGVCEHGKLSGKCCREIKDSHNFYIIAREPELKLGRIKYWVPSYKVGRVLMGIMFEVLGNGPSFEKAFEAVEKNPPLVLR